MFLGAYRLYKLLLIDIKIALYDLYFERDDHDNMIKLRSELRHEVGFVEKQIEFYCNSKKKFEYHDAYAYRATQDICQRIASIIFMDSNVYEEMMKEN